MNRKYSILISSLLCLPGFQSVQAQDSGSELEEVIGISDRAYVMHEGQLTGELDRSELNEESIMRLATNTAEHKEAKI